MLMPKKVKYRKRHKGRMRGTAYRGGTVSFGEYGLQALACGWITDRQIEAAPLVRGQCRQQRGGGGHAGTYFI